MLEKILIVDDDPKIRMSLIAVLEGYDLITATTAEEAMTILKKPNSIELVILDQMLPGKKGTEIIADIKNTQPDVLVVILTGYGSGEIMLQSLRVHADDYWEKPFDPEDMRTKIAALLESKKSSENGLPHDESVIRRIKRYVMRNHDKGVSLNDTARFVSLSPKYLSRFFKEKVGQRFTEFRLEIQMDAARDYLLHSNFNIRTISEKVGYENPESFIKAFKKNSKQTPTSYRVTHRHSEMGDEAGSARIRETAKQGSVRIHEKRTLQRSERRDKDSSC